MKAKKIKTYTNDTDFLVVVYTNQAPNNEVFVVVEEDSCGIIKPEIKGKFTSKAEALKTAKEINKQLFFD